MENNSQQLNENLRSLYEEMKANLCKVLGEQPSHTICLDNREKDTIYGYFYDGDGKLIEQQVKGVQLGMYGIIYVCLDIDAIQYTIEDLLDDDKTPEDLWYSLEELLGYYTLMNINEVLHEYI